MTKETPAELKPTIDYVYIHEDPVPDDKGQDRVALTIGWSCHGVGFGQLGVSAKQVRDKDDEFAEPRLEDIRIDSETMGPDFVRAVMKAFADYVITNAESID